MAKPNSDHLAEDRGEGASGPAAPAPAPAVFMSQSPAPSFQSRSNAASLAMPRAQSIARLATPVPSFAGDAVHGGTPRSASRSGVFPRDATDPAASTTDQLEPVAPLPGLGTSQLASGPGISALAAALSTSFGQSPPRYGTPPRALTPPARSDSSAATPPGDEGNPPPPTSRTPPMLAGSPNGGAQIPLGASPGNTGAYEDPEIVRRHLVHPSDASPDDQNGGDGAKGKEPAELDDEFSSLRLQGGDITRPIYKWTEEAERRSKVQRRSSYSLLRPEPEEAVLNINSIKVPGGFRRNYLRRAIAKDSLAYGTGTLSDNLEDGSPGPSLTPAPRPLLTGSFLEFLTLYGHFAGEELEEDDEVLKPGEYFGGDEDEYSSGEEGHSEDDRDPMEDSALLPPSRRKRRRKGRGGSGRNTPFGAAMLLLKSFVGTGVLFLPRAYLSGGMLFSSLVMIGVAMLSYYCFVLLVTTRLRVEGSFGDLGGILYGPKMRTLILASIVVSQIGFVAAYIVFTSTNLQAFILAVTDCKTGIEIKWLIVLQMLIFLPFSLLRDISKLGATALIADLFIVIGLAYLFYFDVLTLHANGLSDIILFNQRDWTLFIGTAIFTFEGIGLIIPVQESMADPRKFPRIMAIVMVIIACVYTVMGGVSYAAWGSRTETVVLLNLPQDDPMVNAVQLLYSIAILLSTPLALFPAIRITENELFTRSGKYNPYIKWQKNIYRFFVVVVCALIAWGGADNLDKFVALVGNFACIPLTYIYPPLLHYKAVAKNRWWKISDIALCIFGLVAMLYTTSLTIASWANGPEGGGKVGYCDKRNGL